MLLGFPSSSWLNNIPLSVIYHIFFIHSSINRPLGFHILTIMNNAAMEYWNTDITLKYWFCFLWYIYPKMGLLDDTVVLFFLIFMFNWRIVALQYCVGFCHTTIIRYKYTYIPFLWSLPPSPSSHSSWSSQSTRLSSLGYTAPSYCCCCCC